MLNIVIGYDQHESVAFHVLSHSILRRASQPVSITALYLPQLQASGMYTRPRNPTQSTDFTYSRFLTPWIAGLDDYSIFMDCDMLCRTDICEVLDYCPSIHAVNVVKHDYTPSLANKFLNQPQSAYPCKNWSSFMVFNPTRMGLRRLSPSFVSEASAMELHQFKWLHPEDVGSLPVEWNHLVGEYIPNPDAKIVHFTRGGPWFPGYEDCEFANEWRSELNHAMSAKK